MGGNSNNSSNLNLRASLPREHSLLKSFSAIHRHPSLSPVDVLGNDQHHIEIIPNYDANIDTIKRGKSKHGLSHNRRSSTDTTDGPSSPVSGGSRRAITPPVALVVPQDDLPRLPFSSKDGDQQQQHQEHRQTQDSAPVQRKKFQRRSYSPISADVAEEMVKLVEQDLKIEQQQQQQHVTFAPNPEEAVVPSTTSTHRGFRRDYALGDVIRHPSHMVIEPTHDRAIEAVESLNKHDFAFVRRSDGSYSYAILAYRSMEPIKKAHHGEKSSGLEECLVFVMSDIGSTKVVRRRHWSEFVRLVSPANVSNATTSKVPPSVDEHLKKEQQLFFCQEIAAAPVVAYCQEVAPAAAAPVKVVDEQLEDWLPPTMITFDRQQVLDEEMSIISSVSDKARAARRQIFRKSRR